MQVAPPPLSSAEALARYIGAQRGGVSKYTVENYKYRLGKFVQAFPELPLAPEPIEGFIADQGPSDETRHTYRKMIRALYRFLVERQVLKEDENPTRFLRRIRLRKKVPRVFSKDELRRIIVASRYPYERALIVTLIDAGARIGQLAGRTKTDLVEHRFRLVGKGKEYYVPLTPAIAEFLRALPTFHLFPKRTFAGRKQTVDEPADASCLQRAVVRVMKRAGLSGRKLGPHTIRHTFGTLWIDGEGDLLQLQRMLGHESVKSTERYVQISTEAVTRAHRKHSPIRKIYEAQQAATPEISLPVVALPPEAAAVPLSVEGHTVQFMVVADRRPRHVWFYLRARAGAKKWTVAPLGTDLPLPVADAFRIEVQRENARRIAQAAPPQS